MLARLKRARRYLTRRLAHVKRRIANHEKTPLAVARARRIRTRAKQLVKLGPPYKLGGGHGTPADISHGGDCSSFVSECLQAGDVAIPTADTSALAGMLERGSGHYVCVLILTGAGGPNDHTILGVRDDPKDKWDWFEMGGRDNPRPSGAPTRIYPSQARLREFHELRHPKGL